MSWITPVYDRTLEDAQYAARLGAKGDYDYLNDYIAYLGEDETGEDAALSGNDEIVDWDAGLKGALNRSDLARIEGNIAVLAEDLGIEVTTYTASGIPTVLGVSYYRNLLRNVAAIREKYHTTRTPTVPEEPLNTYGKWNDIEQILYEVHDWNENRYFARCGTDTYCGEGGLLL